MVFMTTGKPPILDFNSIKVRLKPYLRLLSDFNAYRFQFHKGTIKTRYLLMYELRWLAYFNSIKVRLKLMSAVLATLLGAFQFHKGTIKTCPYCLSLKATEYFNSIKVRLKRCTQQNVRVCLINFNSIKVRLKL